jgi:drug/metabolite transporter (DMT)-like permease
VADLALSLVMAVWGSSFAILRALLGGGGAAAVASPLALVSVRMALASVLLCAAMAVTPRGRSLLASLKGQLLRDGLIVGALLGAGFVLQIEGLQRTTASRSGFLTGLLVVFVPLLDYVFFKRKPAPPALLGLLLAFAGMTTLSAPWSQTASATLIGDWLTVGCALVFAGHVVVLGRVAAKHPVLPLLLLQLAVTGVMAAISGPFVESWRFSGEPRLWLALLYLALFATLLAFGVQTWSQKILPPVRVALLSALEPVFAALWAGLLLAERLTGREWLGAALILAGVLVGEAGTALFAKAN